MGLEGMPMSIAKPWIASYPPETAPSLEYPRVPLTYFLEQAAADFPERNALFFMGKRIAYRELLTMSYQFANALIKRGVKKGDRVAIMLPNCPQAVISYYGALFAGATVVMTNPLYTERELIHQLHDSGAETIIALDLLYKRVMRRKTFHAFKTSDYYEYWRLFADSEKMDIPIRTEKTRPQSANHLWKRC